MHHGIDEKHAVSYGTLLGPVRNEPLELTAPAVEVSMFPSTMPLPRGYPPITRWTRHRLVFAAAPLPDLEFCPASGAAHPSIRHENHIAESFPQSPTNIIDKLIVEQPGRVRLIQPHQLP